MKGYNQMTPAERSAFIAEQRAELAREIAKLHTDMAARFRAEGVPETEIAAKVEEYFAQPLPDGYEELELAAESIGDERPDDWVTKKRRIRIAFLQDALKSKKYSTRQKMKMQDELTRLLTST